MRDLYEFRRRRFAARLSGQSENAGKKDGDNYEERSEAFQRFRRELLGAEREELLRLRDQGRLSDETSETSTSKMRASRSERVYKGFHKNGIVVQQSFPLVCRSPLRIKIPSVDNLDQSRT